MEKTPNELKPPKPPGRANKKPMYIILLVCLVMGLALMYSMTAQNKKTSSEEKKPSTVSGNQLAQSQGKDALALPPAGKKAPALATATAMGENPQPRKNLVVTTTQPKGQEDSAVKRREQMYLTALASPMIAKHGKGVGRQSGTALNSQTSNTKNGIQSNQSVERQTNYDPASNIDKENFFERADTSANGWLSRHTREAGRPLEIKTGTVIPGVMISGINSDLPGVMIAQVSRNVYDTASGKHLIIPQGAKLYGAYDSRVIYGQERVLVAWNRIIFPDGTSVTLGAMPGADMSGYAGFNDQVNNHYVRIFGSAFLMSVITGGTSYAVDSVGNNSNDSNRTTFQDAMASALAAQMGQTTLRLLEKNLNIKPTLEIRPGYQFNIVVTKDIASKEPYSDYHTGVQHGAAAVRP